MDMGKNACRPSTEIKLCVPMQELATSLAAAQAEAAALRQRLGACEAEAASVRAQLAAQAPQRSSGGDDEEHATYDALQRQVVQVRAAAQPSAELKLSANLPGQSVEHQQPRAACRAATLLFLSSLPLLLSVQTPHQQTDDCNALDISPEFIPQHKGLRTLCLAADLSGV